MNSDVLSKIVLIVLLSTFAIAYVRLETKVQKNVEIEKGIVDQYCVATHKYNVEEYLSCKDSDAQQILINLSNSELGLNLSEEVLNK